MRILSPAFLLITPLLLYIASTRAQRYGGSWVDLPPPQAPPFRRPVDILTDVINALGVRILQEYGETRNAGNVAFSPTGIGFVLAALYEGSAGPGNEQIAHVLGLPRDRDITRIGLRDIHRRLRSYLSPDGFLGGLTLNRENTKLRPEYEDVLKFLGFDLPFEDDRTNATDSSTSVPQTTPDAVTTASNPTSDSSSSTTTEASESIATSTSATEQSASTMTSKVAEDVTTTTQIPEEVAEASTKAPEETTTSTSAEETTAVEGGDGSEESASTEKIPETMTMTEIAEITEQQSSIMEMSTAQVAAVSSTTPIPKTTESAATSEEISSGSTEASSTIASVGESTEPLSSVDSTTLGTMLEVSTTVTAKPEVPETTSTSMEEATETTKPGSTTVESEDVVSIETTTSRISETTTTTESTTTFSPEEEEESKIEVLETSESESEVESSSLNPEESQEQLTTTSTESVPTLEPEETSSNEVVSSDSTTVRIDTTTLDQADEVETIANVDSVSSGSENLLETTTTSSSIATEPSERRRTRRIRIKDPVVRTLLDAGSTEPRTEIEKSEDDEAKDRGTRSPRGYFSNFPDFPSFPVYPDFPGYPEETSWTRKIGGWRVHSPKRDEGSEDSSELPFFVNGEEGAVVSAATYTVVLPFAFLPNLQALALEFPLDDPRYNILLLLPTDRDGTRRLARDLGNVELRELRGELQPAWVRAMIPSFMLKGFVTLTPFLQRLGIRDVFEPREADLSPMTEEEGIYARDVQQSIGVSIRNYMKPDRTHSRNGLFERAGPALGDVMT